MRTEPEPNAPILPITTNFLNKSLRKNTSKSEGWGRWVTFPTHIIDQKLLKWDPDAVLDHIEGRARGITFAGFIAFDLAGESGVI